MQRDDLYAADRQIGSSISGATQPGGFLSLEYYSGWFDVDTRTVLTRCWRTLVGPVLRENYIEEVLAGAPDLYGEPLTDWVMPARRPADSKLAGPFWVPTVLIFSLFLTSSLSTSISAYLAGSSYNYDFTRLGAAVSLVYSYFLGLPCLLWLATKYWAGVSDRSAVDFLGVYGYGSTIWVAVAVSMVWRAALPTRADRAIHAVARLDPSHAAPPRPRRRRYRHIAGVPHLERLPRSVLVAKQVCASVAGRSRCAPSGARSHALRRVLQGRQCYA